MAGIPRAHWLGDLVKGVLIGATMTSPRAHVCVSVCEIVRERALAGVTDRNTAGPAG